MSIFFGFSADGPYEGTAYGRLVDDRVLFAISELVRAVNAYIQERGTNANNMTWIDQGFEEAELDLHIQS